MPVGLFKLVAYGASDIYYCGNPEMSFFNESKYKRHAMFSKDVLELTNSKIIKNNLHEFIIPRQGDISNAISMKFKISSNLVMNFLTTSASPLLTNASPLITSASPLLNIYKLFENIKVYIDVSSQQTLLYNLDSDYIYMNDVIHNQNERSRNKFIGSKEDILEWLSESDEITLRIDLPITKLPIVALQYSQVRIMISLSNLAKELDTKLSLDIEWVYLDVEERRLVAQSAHEIITHVYPSKFTFYKKSCQNSLKCPLILSKKVKYFLIMIKEEEYNETKHFQKDRKYFDKLTLSYNGHNEGEVFDHGYLNEYVPMSKIPNFNKILPDGMFMYSYAINPLDNEQPSGHLNPYSDQFTLEFLFNNSKNLQINIYLLEYNVLRIMSGMTGLAYDKETMIAS